MLSVEGPRTRVPQYGRADFSIVLQGTWSNPYLQEEVTLDMVLTAPSGKTLTLPCFFVEGKSGAQSRWAARFTPQEQGRYSYVFRYAERGRPVSESPKGGFEAGKPAGHGILHPRDNWTLAFDDGTLFRGVAENICWESRDSDDSKFFSELHEQADRFNYDVMLPQFAGAGGNFCRLWMCSWNFPIDRHDRFNNRRYQPSDEYFNPSAVARLDHTVELGENLGVYFMLCMGPGDARTDHSFFVSPEAKARHRNYLRYIVARWGYSPAIGMWEFFNEIDNIQFPGRTERREGHGHQPEAHLPGDGLDSGDHRPVRGSAREALCHRRVQLRMGLVQELRRFRRGHGHGLQARALVRPLLVDAGHPDELVVGVFREPRPGSVFPERPVCQ